MNVKTNAAIVAFAGYMTLPSLAVASDPNGSPPRTPPVAVRIGQRPDALHRRRSQTARGNSEGGNRRRAGLPADSRLSANRHARTIATGKDVLASVHVSTKKLGGHDPHYARPNRQDEFPGRLRTARRMTNAAFAQTPTPLAGRWCLRGA